MSFYVYGHHRRKSPHLDRALALAENGQIGHALVMWKKHNDAGCLCGCEEATFDQVRCGFCFVGKLLLLDLLEGHRNRGVPYAQTIEAVRGYIRSRPQSGLEVGASSLGVSGLAGAA